MGNRQKVKSGQVPKSDMYVLCKAPSLSAAKTERVNERASEGERACLLAVCTGGIVTGCVPWRAALGLCWIFSGTRCAQGCWVSAEVPSFPSFVHGSRTRTPSICLVWSSHPCYQARGYGGDGIRRWTAPLQSECDSEMIGRPI